MSAQGTGQNNLGKNWGNGCCSDPAVISALGLSDPNHFFSQLLTKPYVDQIIFGPHVYGPEIIGSTSPQNKVWLLVVLINIM